MSTLGNTANPPNGGAYYYVSSGKNQYASQFTMGATGGYITSVSAYFDLYTGSGTCYVCVWDGATGNLLGSASVGGLSAGSTGVDNQHWHTATFAGNGIYITPSQSVWLGIWTPGNCLWTTDSSGSTYSDSQSSGPGSFATHGGEQGNGFPVYATYTPGGIMHVNTGTPASPNWVSGPVSVNTGTPAAPVWTPAAVSVNTGTPAAPVWTPAT